MRLQLMRSQSWASEIGDFLFWLVIFFGLVTSLTLLIELRGIWRLQNVSYLSPQLVTEAERSREDGETWCDTPLLSYLQCSNQSEPNCLSMHPSIQINKYKNPDWDSHLPACLWHDVSATKYYLIRNLLRLLRENNILYRPVNIFLCTVHATCSWTLWTLNTVATVK